jgi:hypothetical protein
MKRKALSSGFRRSVNICVILSEALTSVSLSGELKKDTNWATILEFSSPNPKKNNIYS